MERNTMKQFFFYFCMLFGNLLGIVAGMTLSWTSPVLPKLEKTNSDNPLGEGIDETDGSWIGGLLSLGAVFGPFLAAFAAEKFGRKWALVLIDIPYIATFVTLAFAETLWLYMLARTIVGLAIGGTFTVLPMYIAELCPDALRGTMGGIMNTFIVSGIFLSYVIGPYVSILAFNIICAGVSTSFLVICILLMPETPQWLISKGKESQARDVLKKLRNTESVEDELQAICDIVRENSGGSFKDVFVGGNLKALIVAASLVSFQQFSGINIVLFYSQTIFEDSGSSIASEVSAMIVGGVQVVASFITPLLADRTGRKFLFVLSAAGMLIAIASLVLYIILYNCGFGALPWTVMAEIFPPDVKSIASSLTASTCWFFSFILTKFFTDVSAEIGIGGSFWLFAGFNLLSIVFVLTYVPETKGKSQKEIQQMLSG